MTAYSDQATLLNPLCWTLSASQELRSGQLEVGAVKGGE